MRNVHCLIYLICLKHYCTNGPEEIITVNSGTITPSRVVNERRSSSFNHHFTLKGPVVALHPAGP